MTIARPEPARTCIVTRAKLPKRELIRIVRTRGGDVRCDPTGRVNGRGAYLSLGVGCVQTALARGILSKRLGVAINPHEAEILINHVERVRLARLAGSTV